MTATALVSVSWGVLALGAVYPWAYWPLQWGALITGLLGLRRGSTLPHSLGHPMLLAVLVLCGAVLLQLIPLSPFVIRAVSPATSSFVQNYVQLPIEIEAATDGTFSAESTTAWRPLSLRPRATVTALVFTLTLGLMVTGGALGLRTADARRLAVGLLALGAIVAFIAIVQRATPTGRIYWIWEPHYRDTAWGPFVNRNHFAGWMVMAISAGLGYFMALSNRAMRRIDGWRNRVLWLSTREASAVVLAGLALGIMGFSLALTASRSGAGCLLASMLVVVMATLGRRRTLTIPRQRRMVMVGYIACLAFVTVIWTGVPLIENRFTYSSTSTPFSLGWRIRHWSDALDVVRHFPVTGTGLNTYTVVTPFFQSIDTPTSDEAHNDYLQLAAEGGLLVGIPAIILVGLFIREVRRRFLAGGRSPTSYWLRVGAVAGLIGIALQESVDFSLQLPGNAVMFAALCAVAVHKPDESD